MRPPFLQLQNLQSNLDRGARVRNWPDSLHADDQANFKEKLIEMASFMPILDSIAAKYLMAQSKGIL